MQSLRQYRSGDVHARRVLELRERRQRSHSQAALISADLAQGAVQPAEADEARGLEQARLHHQHQRGGAADGAYAWVLGIEERDRFVERRRLQELEPLHAGVSVRSASIAFFRLAPNSRDSLALVARNTDSPSPPNLPVSPTSLA